MPRTLQGPYRARVPHLPIFLSSTSSSFFTILRSRGPVTGKDVNESDIEAMARDASRTSVRMIMCVQMLNTERKQRTPVLTPLVLGNRKGACEGRKKNLGGESYKRKWDSGCQRAKCTISKCSKQRKGTWKRGNICALPTIPTHH